MLKTRTAPLSHSPLGRSQRPTSLVARVMTFLTVHRERHALSKLDDHMLQDIGYSRYEAEKEANRPIWDAPSRWMR